MGSIPTGTIMTLTKCPCCKNIAMREDIAWRWVCRCCGTIGFDKGRYGTPEELKSLREDASAKENQALHEKIMCENGIFG